MIKPLTSLRFFFAFFVFLSHINFVKTDNLLFNWLQRNIFFEGYLGVSFFFILSGFVLAYSYKEKFEQGLISKKKFYLARFARIYPLHFITLISAIPLAFSQNAFSWIKLVLNIFLLQSFVPVESFYFGFNSPSWSISDEMFFYLMFPFITLILTKKSNILNFLAITIFICIVLMIFLVPQKYHKVMFYFSPFLRLFDFIWGILLFILFRNIKFQKIFKSVKFSTLTELFAIFVFILFFVSHNYIPRGFRFSVYYWIPMCFIIYIFAQNKGWISKILSNKILVFLGEVSFGFYMIHYLVITYGNMLAEYYLANFSGILLSLIYFAVTLVLSCLSFIYFEKPMNTFIKKKLIKQ